LVGQNNTVEFTPKH